MHRIRKHKRLFHGIKDKIFSTLHNNAFNGMNNLMRYILFVTTFPTVIIDKPAFFCD